MNIVRLFPVLFLWVIVLLTSVEVVCALEPVTSQSVEEGGAVINQGSSIEGDHGTSSKDSRAGVLIIVLAISGILLLFALWTKRLEKQARERTTELEATNKSLEFEIAGYKQAEDTLQKSESKYRTLFENLPQKIFLKDTHSSYISCNENYARDLGIMPEEIVGKTDYDFYPRELADKYRGDDKRILESGQTERLEEQYVQGGKEASVAIIKVPVMDKRGTAMGILGTFLDITEQKKAEQELQKYQQRLKSLAVQLTLAEERERRRIAEDLHDYIGQSLALARMQLAAAGKGLPKSDERAALFDDVSQTLLKAIQDTRNLTFELSSPSLNELGLAAAISEWMDEYVMNMRGIEARFVDHAQNVQLDVDQRTILFRNVRELLTNAIKHARAKNISVWLESTAEGLEITVQDDGVGFDSSIYRQSVDDCKGFGLFSVRERMSDLGGKLTLDSQPGAGCKAALVLPIKEQTLETEA